MEEEKEEVSIDRIEEVVCEDFQEQRGQKRAPKTKDLDMKCVFE